MGIKDLLQNLKSIQKIKNVSSYAGKTVAIDGYCWLHQGAYTCAQDLVYGRGIDKLIAYCKKRLQMLVDSNVKPILIFDGAKLQMKMGTEAERERSRTENRRKAEDYLKHGNSILAHKMFSAAVDITPEMAYKFVHVAKQMGIEFIVAPYEADAQLAFMFQSGQADVIITEDSDLLAFGAKKCFFKMDMTGQGVEIDINELSKVEELNFRTFTQDMLLITCILSGCDYIDSIKGIGFKKAHRLVYETGMDVKGLFRRIRREGKFLIPSTYEKTFEKALLTFKFQRVYCPKKQALILLNDPETHELGPVLKSYENWDFLGAEFDAETAQKIAECELDPIQLRPLKEMVEKREELDRQQRSQRVVYRKNRGVTNKTQGADSSQQQQQVKQNGNLKKFFGVPKTQMDVEMAFSGEEQPYSQQSVPDISLDEENKEEQKTVKKPTSATAFRPQFRLKSQHSQKSFSSQGCSSLSQKSHSQSGDESSKQKQQNHLSKQQSQQANERHEQRMQDFVANGSKKRTLDMITKDENGDPNQIKEQSSEAHVSNYFKKLKQSREDQENEDDTFSANQSYNHGISKSNALMRTSSIIKQESWTVKRSENNSLANIQSVSYCSTVGGNSGETQQTDQLAEMDKRYPGFKKGKGYLKLEQQSRQLSAKTSLLSDTFSTSMNSLRQKMTETRESLREHQGVRVQVNNMLSKRIQNTSSSSLMAATLKDQESEVVAVGTPNNDEKVVENNPKVLIQVPNLQQNLDLEQQTSNDQQLKPSPTEQQDLASAEKPLSKLGSQQQQLDKYRFQKTPSQSVVRQR